MKPRVVVFSNCIGAELVRLFNMVPAFQQRCEAVYVRNWAVRKGFSELDASALEGCAILLYQLRQLDDEASVFAHVPPSCTRVSFAAFTMQPLWPTFVHVNREGYRDQRCLNGMFPFGDSLALQLLSDGRSPDEAFEAYMATDVKALYDLDRLAEIASGKTRTLNARADIDLWDVLSDTPFDRRRFRNAMYPTPETILHMGVRLFRGFGMGEIPATVAHEFLATSPNWRLNVPLHPQIIEHFGLSWADPNEQYDYLEGAALTFPEYVRAYLQHALPSVTGAQQALFSEMQRLAPWERTVPVAQSVCTTGTDRALLEDDTERVIAALPMPVQSARILDVCAGEGYRAASLAASGAQVVALVASDHAAEQARWLARCRGADVAARVDVQVADVFHPGPVPPVDVVLCADLLERLDNPRPALAALRATTTGTGLLWCRVAMAHTDVISVREPGSGAHCPSPALLATMLVEAGFAHVELLSADDGVFPRTLWLVR